MEDDTMYLEVENDTIDNSFSDDMIIENSEIPMEEFDTAESSSSGPSNVVILSIVISICVILGIILGVILGRRAAKK